MLRWRVLSSNLFCFVATPDLASRRRDVIYVLALPPHHGPPPPKKK
jgi:hypothetical protein